MSHPKRLMRAVALAAALAGSSIGVGTIASAQTPAPTPVASPAPVQTPEPTPTPTPTTQPSQSICFDRPQPFLSWPTFHVPQRTPDSVTVRWMLPSGCWAFPMTIKITVDGELRASFSVPYFTFEDNYVIGGLEPSTTHTVSIEAFGPSGSKVQTFATDRPVTTLAAGETEAPVPVPDPRSTPQPTPTPAPTPAATPAPEQRFCFDRTWPLVSWPTFHVPQRTPDSVTVRWILPDGCWTWPFTVKIVVDGELRSSETVPFQGPQGDYTITGLEPSSTHSVSIAAYSRSGAQIQTFATDRQVTTLAAGETEAPVPVPDPRVTPQPTPSPTLAPPTPGPPTPAPVRTTAFTTKTSLAVRTSGTSGTFAGTPTASVTAPTIVAAPGSPTQVQLGGFDATGTLVLGGLLPVNTRVAFGGGSFSAATNGGMLSGTLQSAFVIRRATILGLPLTSGDTCRTVADTTTVVRSVGVFSPTQGGRLDGTVTLGAFKGCGALASSLGATTKSTASFTLTPAAK